jgi:hypothetical protein
VRRRLGDVAENQLSKLCRTHHKMTTTPFISIQVLARVQKLASAIDKLLM